MSRMQTLQDQAARAERLANGALDHLTVERLLEFAAECRAEVKAISEHERSRETELA